MIVASDLGKSFTWSGRTTHALSGVSFGVSAGEVFGLLGPNGAGKTTTLRIIMGLLAPDRGFVEVDGVRAVQGLASRMHIGMVSTNDGVYPWLTAQEMLMYFADLYGVPMDVARRRLAVLAERLQLTEFLRQRCSTLSTGQRQRVILARGLMHDPPVMLLDEPTRGMDVVGSQTVFEFIAHLKQQGKSVLLSTHRLDEAERICDRFGLLHRGRLMVVGNLEEIRAATGQRHLTEMFLTMMRDSDARPAEDGSASVPAAPWAASPPEDAEGSQSTGESACPLA